MITEQERINEIIGWTQRNAKVIDEYHLNPITHFGVKGPCLDCGVRTGYMSGLCLTCRKKRKRQKNEDR